MKNFNIGHNFNTIRGRALIFHVCIPYDKTFHMFFFFDFVTFTLKFDLCLKNLNLGCYLVMVVAQRASSSDNSYLCHPRSIAAHRDHFIQGLSVFVCLSGSHTFLAVLRHYMYV